MNDRHTLEHEVETTLGEHAPMTPPNHLLQSFEFNARRTRRYPRWLAIIKEPTMRSDSHLAVGSPTARVAAIIIATILLAATVIGAGFAGSRIILADDGPIVVDETGGGDYRTIGQAVAAAEDGDEILVRPGTYAEGITLDKGISLTGDGPIGDIVVSAEDGSILIIDGDVALSGISFTGPASDGVKVIGGTVLLEDLVFDHVGEPFTAAPCARPCWSIDVDGPADVVVRKSQFLDGGEIIVRGGAAVDIEGNTLSGGPHIALFDLAPGSVVRNNTIADSESRGIGLYEPTDALITGNTITDTPEYGITVGWSDSPGVDPVVVANTISGAANGIDVARSAEPQLDRNVLFDNGVGIVIRGSDAFLGANDLSANGTGMVITAGSPELDQNIVSGGAVGLALSSAARPVLSANSICDNDANVRLTGDARLIESAENEICADEPAE